jgi:succinoglycan biosynthesis transport protein ExoP
MADTPQLQAADVNLHDYLDIIRRRKWIIIQTFAVVAAIGLITTMMTTPIYRATAKLKVEAAPLTITTQNSENPLASILSQSQPDSVETQIQMLQTEPFVQKVLDGAAVPVRADRPAPVIKVSNIDRTNVIVVQVESPSPREAARVAQTMLELHKQEAKETSTKGLTDALKFVTRESRKAKAALDRAEQQLEAFRSRNRVTELTAEQESQIKNFIEMETQLLATRNNVTRVKAEMAEIQDQLKKEPEQSEARVINENPRHSLLQNQLDDLKQRRVALLQLYQENNYRVRNLDAEIAAMEARLKREPEEKKTIQRMPNSTRFDLRARSVAARAELRGLAAAHAHLEAAVAKGRSIMNTMGHLPIRLARYNRERDMAEAAYNSLEESRRELEIRYNAQRDTAHIIEPAAIPRVPIRPRKALNLMFASLMGLCLGVSMAFLQEFLDDRINSPEDIQRIVDAPVLGYIPMMTDGQERLMTELPALSPVAESYRGLRSSISFAAVDKPLETLVVSSSNQGEGKSLTSVNLAVAMAMGNRRVVLVDADLRRPNVHRLLRIEQSPGLTVVLVGDA